MINLKYMDIALSEAKKAFDSNEVPVGCVIVKNSKILATAHNTCIQKNNSTLHAEMNAIEEAITACGQKDLQDCDVYVTLEPCAMCAGALINAKVKRVYIGAMEPKSGCFGSVTDFNQLDFNHRIETYYGIKEDECKDIIKKFFENKR